MHLPVMKTHIQIMTAGLLLCAAATANTEANACHYEQLQLGSKTVVDGKYTLNLGNGDDIYHPAAWTGPLKIRQPDGTSCTASADVSIMQRPIYSDDARLIVSTYSGGNQRVYVVDEPTCRTLWVSDPFSGNVAVRGDRLYINGKAIKLGKDCVPMKVK